MRRRIILLSVVFCLTHFPSWAEKPDSIWFAGQVIKIGSPKKQVFPRLATEYKLEKIADSDQWLVNEKAPPYHFVGIILFENEKVAFINKDWGSYGDESIDAFEMLHRALSNVSEQKKATATIIVGETKEPQASVKTITLYFGKREFTISVIEPAGKSKSVGFSEILQK